MKWEDAFLQENPHSSFYLREDNFQRTLLNENEDLHTPLRVSTDDEHLNSQTQDVDLSYSTFAPRRRSASGPWYRGQVPSSRRRAISGSSSTLSSNSHKILPPIGKTAIDDEIANNSSLPVDDDNTNGEAKNKDEKDNEKNTL